MGVWLTLPNLPGVALWDIARDDFAPDEQWMWQRNEEVRGTIVSRSTVHRTDPQTIAYALADSPAGAAAYILGRRRDWSDNDGDVFSVFDRDFLCTTASIYWLTGSIASSMRIYKEHYTGGRPPAPRPAAWRGHRGADRLRGLPRGTAAAPACRRRPGDEPAPLAGAAARRALPAG